MKNGSIHLFVSNFIDVIDEDREEEEEDEEREIRPINLSRAAAHLSQVPVLEF